MCALLLWRVALRFPLPQLSDEQQSPLNDPGWSARRVCEGLTVLPLLEDPHGSAVPPATVLSR
jgi:hypothetical protein